MRVPDEHDGATPFSVLFDPSEAPVPLKYVTSDGTELAGSDYTETSGTLRFAAGETSKTASVPVLQDGQDEGSEAMTLTLSNASGARLKDAEATGTIGAD